jgi:protein involved in polysaccharide export with SLBB domain
MDAGPTREYGEGCEHERILRTRPTHHPLGSLARLARRFLFSSSLASLIIAGCATNHDHVDRNLMADKGTSGRNEGTVDHYLVGCPDVLEVTIPNRPELSGRFTIGPDGRIEMERLGRPRVEGHTAPQIARLLADQARITRYLVQVRVADYQSQEVYLFGQVSGLQRAVPYEGPETVLDLLQRTGGITPGAAPADIFVIRSRVAEGRRPEVFHVDLRAIVLNHDDRTNVRVRPFDQIHVGETRQARIERSIPPWLRPFYQTVWDTRPKNPSKPDEPDTTSPGERLALAH